ncbi:MAG TPA: hypothetical protein VN238_22175 [Solirubrobacteraceae bacterium]|nr:hypothetical protein [Solirubrobacteraceae bacterium]
MEKVRRTVTIDAELDRKLRELSDEPLSTIVDRALRKELKYVRYDWMRRNPLPEPGPSTQEQIDAVLREIDALWES